MPPIPESIGRYQILELVGRGGMGVLYRARDPVLERDVAVKMMLIDFSHDQTARERFEREAKAVARLQHRNVVTIHELGEVDGTPYIVMEFLTGRDLDAYLKSGEPMPLAQKLDVVIQLCEGLGYAHEQGIVHRDIKPGNVRVLEDGTVKILDFGIAKFAMSSMTQSGTIMGTPSYMAPEQIMGKPVDGRADLFSAGVLLYELLSGQKPFNGESPTTVVYQIMHEEPAPVRAAVPELPESLHEIVSRALQKNPDERYSRASEMAADLQMVRMMLDLPLKGPETDKSVTHLDLSRLHATTIGTKSGVTAALDAPMRGSAAAKVADAAPQAAASSHGLGRGLIAGVAAGIIVLVGIGVLWMRSGGNSSSGGTSAATQASAQAAPTTPASGSSAAPGGTAKPAGPAGSPSAPPVSADVYVVSSSPSGAHISVNGSDTGQVTPSPVSFGAKMPATVTLTLKGYQALTTTVSDADLKSGRGEFKLVREAGPVQLTITGAYPFDVLQGGNVLSAAATRHEVTVRPGGGPVVARNPDFMLNSPVAVDYTRPQAEVTLPQPGTLAVFSTNETCKIAVDGQDLGFPPIPNKRVAAGPHSVTLKCPDGKEDSRKVNVPSGDRTAVTFGSQRED